MILEQRCYLVRPGKVGEYLKHVEEVGWPVMRAVQGGLVGYFVAETGRLNEVVHLWAYEDLADRARRRARLDENAEWQEFLRRVLPLIERMDSRILHATRPTPLTLEMIRAANEREVD